MCCACAIPCACREICPCSPYVLLLHRRLHCHSRRPACCRQKTQHCGSDLRSRLTAPLLIRQAVHVSLTDNLQPAFSPLHSQSRAHSRDVRLHTTFGAPCACGELLYLSTDQPLPSSLQWLQRQAAPAESASSSGQTSPRVHTPAVTERLVAARPQTERTPFERLIAERTLSERCERSPLHSSARPPPDTVILHPPAHADRFSGAYRGAYGGSLQRAAGRLSPHVV